MVVKGGNVLHHVNGKGNCPWGSASGVICQGGLVRIPSFLIALVS